jgi:hypothetical protein
VAGRGNSFVSVKRSSSLSPTCAQPKRISRSNFKERANPRAHHQQTSHAPPIPISRIIQTREGSMICISKASAPITGKIFAFKRMDGFISLFLKARLSLARWTTSLRQPYAYRLIIDDMVHLLSAKSTGSGAFAGFVTSIARYPVPDLPKRLGHFLPVLLMYWHPW